MIVVVVIALNAASLKNGPTVPQKFLEMKKEYSDWLRKNWRLPLQFEGRNFSHSKDTCYTVRKTQSGWNQVHHAKQTWSICVKAQTIYL